MKKLDLKKTLDPEDYIITFEDFVRFLDGVDMRTECVNCGEDGNWKIYTALKKIDKNTVLGVYKKESATTGATRYTYSMSCGQCGSARDVNAKFVLGWLQENPEESTDE